MAYNPLNQYFIKKILEGPFKPAKRNQDGDIVLQRSSLFRIGPVVSFFIGIPVLFASLTDTTGEYSPFLPYVILYLIAFGALSLFLLSSKTVVSEQNVTSYRLFGKKQLDFNSITGVTYTKLYTGCAVLEGKGTTILVPLDTYGFIDFYNLLNEKIGTDKCIPITNELAVRKKQLEPFSS